MYVAVATYASKTTADSFRLDLEGVHPATLCGGAIYPLSSEGICLSLDSL